MTATISSREMEDRCGIPNVIVSGLIGPAGTPGRVLAAMLDGRVDAIVSPALLDELLDVISRPRLARYEIDDVLVGAILELVWPGMPGIDIEAVLPGAVLRDGDDRIVVEAAVAGAASTIVAGDRDLLDNSDLVGWLAHRGISLVTPADLLELLETEVVSFLRRVEPIVELGETGIGGLTIDYPARGG
jgi:putative PIN family toxin of toxin-antitoxin system